MWLGNIATASVDISLSQIDQMRITELLSEPGCYRQINMYFFFLTSCKDTLEMFYAYSDKNTAQAVFGWIELEKYSYLDITVGCELPFWHNCKQIWKQRLDVEYTDYFKSQDPTSHVLKMSH